MKNVESSMLFVQISLWNIRNDIHIRVYRFVNYLKIVWLIYMYTWFIFTTFDFVIWKYQIRTLLYSVNLWETSNRVCYSFKFLWNIQNDIHIQRIDSWIIENLRFLWNFKLSIRRNRYDRLADSASRVKRNSLNGVIYSSLLPGRESRKIVYFSVLGPESHFTALCFSTCFHIPLNSRSIDSWTCIFVSTNPDETLSF